jgi:hypothetical protein
MPGWKYPQRILDDGKAQQNFDALKVWADNQSIVLNVVDYGATGSGTVDDTIAIQRAIQEAGEAGGGSVYFPPGNYLISQQGTAAGIPWCLYNQWDNIHLDFGPGATLTSTDDDACQIFSSGWSKPAGPASWDDYWLGQASTNTYYDIATAAKSANSLTLSSAGDATNFEVGDYIYIRTGQLVAARTTEPDAEINQVTSISGAVLGLRWPTAKPYEQEYWPDSSETGVTSTTPTAWEAPYGVAVITDRVLHNFKITGGRFVATAGSVSIIRSHACIGTVIEGVQAEIHGGFVDAIESRDNTFHDWRVVNDAPSGTNYLWPFAFGTGCVGGLVENVNAEAYGTRMLSFHIHEGSSQITVKDSRCTNSGTGSDLQLLSIRARGYDILVEDCTFDCGSNTHIVAAVTEDVTGGVTLNNVVALTSGGSTNGIYIAATNVTLRNIPDQQKVYQLDGGRAPQSAGNVEYLTATILHTDTTVNLGTLPAYSMPLAQLMSLDVRTAFTDTGTDLLKVGWSGTTNALLTDISVGTVGRVNITSAEYGASAGRVNATAREVFATYTGSNADAGAGVCTIVIPYVRVPSEG